MKKILAILIALLNTAASALYIYKMPEGKYPVHWGPDLQPDRYGGKWELLIAPAVCLVLVVLFVVYRYLTRNNENIQKNRKYENICIPIVFVLVATISWGVILGSNGAIKSLDIMPTAICVLLGLMFVVMSNYMGKIKQNRYFGIKMRATLNNVTVWRKTHRLAGILGTIGGLLMIAAGIVCMIISNFTVRTVIMIALLVAAICLFGVIPGIYAAKLYKELGDDDESVGWYGTDKKGE